MKNRTEYQKIYGIWRGIWDRCYNSETTTYKLYGAKGVRMCDEWKDNFTSFEEWYKENYYEVDVFNMQVDKDIIGDGKLYSPETCLIVPNFINAMFCNGGNKKKNDLPKGVTNGWKGTYDVRVSIKGKTKYLGHYETVEIAQKVYNECKEAVIHGVAEEYKNKIPFKVYNALINYKFGD